MELRAMETQQASRKVSCKVSLNKKMLGTLINNVNASLLCWTNICNKNMNENQRDC